jgi:thiamine biosynthesis lipoprotein
VIEPALHRFTALGTVGVLGVTDPSSLPAVMAVVDEEIATCDRACSRFRADSELTRLNDANGRTVDVTATLADYLAVALMAAQATGGLVDPTVGQALISLGYDRDFPSVGVAGASGRDGSIPVVTFAPVRGWGAVHVDARRRRARVEPGVRVDLGATAKAHCADRAARTAAAAAGCGVLVSLGGDVAVSGQAPEGGWRIKVTDDSAADPASASGPIVAVVSGGLATSGVTVRTWRRGGDQLHHIIDPKRGLPVPPVWRTVSTAAPSCVDANVASTAAMVLGAGAPEWLANRSTPARLVAPNGAVLTVAGWPAEQLSAETAVAGAST